MDMKIYIFLMDLFSLFFSCLMLGKAHWILLWPPDICNIKVVSKVHNVNFLAAVVLHVCIGLYLECLLYIWYLVCMWWSGSVCLILVCADWHLHFCRCGIMGNFESEVRGMEVGENQILNLQTLKLCWGL
jgi:hypothetical protein